MSDRVDISEPLKTLCALLGLEYNDAAEIVIRPAEVIATRFLKNDEGNKFVDPDTDRVAFEKVTFAVRT